MTARQRIGLSPRMRFGVGALLMVIVVAVGSLYVGPAVALAAPGSSTGSPQTASGCNQNVCIYVVGSGTYVTRWSTTASLPATMCTVADYWANGVLVFQGTTKCGSSGGNVMSYWTHPGYFPAGTEVCNTWKNVPGKPCETIE